MRAAIFGKRWNTLGSVSIAVETERPVLGHLIMTELMGRASGFVPAPLMEIMDRDRPEAAAPLQKSLGDRNDPGNQNPRSTLFMRKFQSGGFPPYPPE